MRAVAVKLKIEDFCKKCNNIVTKRLVKDKKYPYYMCSICTGNNSKSHRLNNWSKYLAQKANARKRENSIKITGEHIDLLLQSQDNKCIVSGVTFDMKSKWNKPSLDRIDNTRGYTLDNIQLVTWIVNHTRGELTVEEYIQLCKQVSGAT